MSTVTINTASATKSRRTVATSKFFKPLFVVLSMLRVPTGFVIGAHGYQVIGGARGESVVICSVFGKLYGTVHDEYVVILGLLPNKTTILDLNQHQEVRLQVL
jgi:hypothetical protein